MKPFIMASICVTILLLAPGGRAAAQDGPAATEDCPDGCWMCWNLLVGSEWYHTHNGNGDFYGCVGSANTHFESATVGRCLESDGSCNRLAAELPDKSRLTALVRANAAADILRLQQEYPVFLVVDLAEGALRVNNCEGLTSFKVPLSKTLLTKLSSFSETAVELDARVAGGVRSYRR